MASMLHPLSEIAFGAETAAGTLVVADTGLVVDEGLATYEEIIERTVREAPRGVLAETAHLTTRKQSGLSYTQDLTYEEFPIVLLGGLKTVAAVTGVTDETYTFLPSLTTPDAITPFSFEAFSTDGTTQHFKRKFGHGQCSGFSVNGAFGSPAQLNATWFGRAGQDLTTPASPAVLARNLIPSDLFKLYIDGAWADLGSTQKSALLRSFTYTVDTGVQPDFVLAGRTDLDYPQLRRGMITGDVQLVAEFDADAATEVAAWRSDSMRFIRLEVEGPLIGAVPHKITLDAAVTYLDAPDIAEADGLVTVTLNGRFRHDATSGNVMSAEAVSEIASY